MGTLHRQSEEFDERNLFLQVLLGLVAVADRFERVVDEWAPAARPGTAPAASAVPDRSELLLLGLVAISRRFQAHLPRADAETPAATEPAVPSRGAQMAPDMLRRLLV